MDCRLPGYSNHGIFRATVLEWDAIDFSDGNSDRLYFLGSKISADGDCSHEIKRPLLLGRKAMINLDIILKSRDIILPTKF